MTELPDGLLVIVHEDCPTCRMIAPLLVDIKRERSRLAVISQDNPGFPEALPGVVYDRDLDLSYRLKVETVPTLIRLEEGREVGRLVGWQRDAWRELTGVADLGAELPAQRPGCGALNTMPGIAEELAIRHGDAPMSSRVVEIGAMEDAIEACYQRGWSDGLPVVPPTQVRVYRMLQGTSRRADEVVAVLPTNHAPVTVEKAAINAVMAGCKPEYLPVVLAAVEAACDEAFCLGGLAATTWFSYPVMVVNGPVTRAIGMNSGFNALGPGNRANATIGRALNLVLRNVGQVRPGEIDRATLGQPGKYTFCFAEAEEGTSWQPLSVERGMPAGKSAVTLFGGEGVQPIGDQISRTPDSLARSFAAALRAVYHPKIAADSDVMLVVSPEHARVFETAGWSKARLARRLEELTRLPAQESARGAGGIEEGVLAEVAAGREWLPKFRKGGILIVRAGSDAGLWSAILTGWPLAGAKGTAPVTRLIDEV